MQSDNFKSGLDPMALFSQTPIGSGFFVSYVICLTLLLIAGIDYIFWYSRLFIRKLVGGKGIDGNPV